MECGAFTGEDRSNTLFFEKTRRWLGLLIEADPNLYAQVRKKNRKAFSINACLSPEPYPALVSSVNAPFFSFGVLALETTQS